jgi:serine/threonine-protein phosphatase PP1 catalytic subunit
MSDNNQGNFINFINHLLTFNKQYELLKKQTLHQPTHNIDSSKSDKFNNILPFRFNINVKVMIKLCELALPFFRNEPNIVILEAPIYIFGDIHGQFSDLIHFLEMTGLPPDNKFLFLGDYVDRGNNSIEVCALLFAMKIIFPTCVYLLRGNHECPEVNSLYGLLGECESRYGSEAQTVFNKINEVLCSLPICSIINNKIFCVHGGLSPHLQTIKQINQINRFCKIPDDGLLCDLMWSDPANITDKWGINSRGVSCTYNPEAISNFLKNNKLQLLCRAHQLVSEGYKFFSNNKLVTVFSAPNYCGNCGNDGAVVKITDKLVCSFIIIKPVNIEINTNDIHSSSNLVTEKRKNSKKIDNIDT